jgi:hypothetical protein
VRGVVAELPDLRAGAPGVTKLAVKTQSQTNATMLIDFIEIGRVGVGGSSRSFMPQYCLQLPLRAPRKLLNAHHFLAVNLWCYPEQAKPTPESFQSAGESM